jgi:hypothetical protein
VFSKTYLTKSRVKRRNSKSKSVRRRKCRNAHSSQIYINLRLDKKILIRFLKAIMSRSIGLGNRLRRRRLWRINYRSKPLVRIMRNLNKWAVNHQVSWIRKDRRRSYCYMWMSTLHQQSKVFEI